jgi:hypothetical protein
MGLLAELAPSYGVEQRLWWLPDWPSCQRKRTSQGHGMGHPDLHTTVPTHSVWEIVGQADGGLSVLRTFRLLRVLKLVRFLPALRRQLVVLMRTMDNVATFCMLLMLFIFIFRWVGPKLLPQTAPGMVGGAAPF